jgi:hypothetical protein
VQVQDMVTSRSGVFSKTSISSQQKALAEPSWVESTIFVVLSCCATSTLTFASCFGVAVRKSLSWTPFSIDTSRFHGISACLYKKPEEAHT